MLLLQILICILVFFIVILFVVPMLVTWAFYTFIIVGVISLLLILWNLAFYGKTT